jgi:6-phosphogluconate dehydrogenase (decarboxylating)
MKLGIIGFGRFGRYLSKKLKNFDILTFDVVGSNVSPLAEVASLPIVVFAVPMRGLREALYRCRPLYPAECHCS